MAYCGCGRGETVTVTSLPNDSPKSYNFVGLLRRHLTLSKTEPILSSISLRVDKDMGIAIGLIDIPIRPYGRIYGFKFLRTVSFYAEASNTG